MAGTLYTRPGVPGLRALAYRVLLVVALISGAILVVYFEGGLLDSSTGERPGFLDCVYFAMVTITTVGYGDIGPVGTTSRLIDALVLTPIRFVVLFTILGTAYELALRRFREEYRMKKISEKLDQHVILCGCGASGKATVRELLLQGMAKDQIVVVDIKADAFAEVAELGVICIIGDATREHVLHSIVIEKAAFVLVAPGRDDTAALITLTVRSLNPDACIVAMCKEGENVKLLERGGAHHIVHPAYAGGALMAAAARRTHLMETMTDLLSVAGDLKLDERRIRDDEIGKVPGALRGIAVVRVYRSGRFFDVDNLPTLEAGDTLVFIARGDGGGNGAA